MHNVSLPWINLLAVKKKSTQSVDNTVSDLRMKSSASV